MSADRKERWNDRCAGFMSQLSRRRNKQAFGKWYEVNWRQIPENKGKKPVGGTREIGL